LEDTDEFYAIGGEEYFDKGICLIEWGEQIKDALPKNYKTITFSRDLEHETRRVINFEGFEDIEF
jgi:tRNA A37 threonylcarbamoyladenosine biosynthesis protein TsaE